MRIRAGQSDRARCAPLKPRRLAIDPLEDRRLLSATASVVPAFRDLVSASVAGRYVFYNNSAFDGGNPAANAADDAAIARSKLDVGVRLELDHAADPDAGRDPGREETSTNCIHALLIRPSHAFCLPRLGESSPPKGEEVPGRSAKHHRAPTARSEFDG